MTKLPHNAQCIDCNNTERRGLMVCSDGKTRCRKKCTPAERYYVVGEAPALQTDGSILYVFIIGSDDSPFRYRKLDDALDACTQAVFIRRKIMQIWNSDSIFVCGMNIDDQDKITLFYSEGKSE